MITQDAFTLGHGLITTILQKMENIGVWRRRFISEVLLTFLSVKGRINFLQLGRYGNQNERSYRNQFEDEFDFMRFNRLFVQTACSSECILAFDPSFITKSGKHTPGVGYFYSGCSGSYERGLEIGCISAIDIKQNTAYHLEAIQSPAWSKKQKELSGKTLIDHYSELLIAKKDILLTISNIIAVDAYFSKRKFVDKIIAEMGMEIISRMRDDANLLYRYQGKLKPGKGRPKLYAGKLNVKQVDKRRILKAYEDEEVTIYGGIVFSVGLKRYIKLAYVEFKNQDGEINSTKFFFSTNVYRDAKQILSYYRSRFQMEFLFRDAKQHAGLETCQARSEKKLHFHFNASLTAVNVGKAIIRKHHGNQDEIAISIADIKTELNNRLLAQTIFSIYGLDPNLLKNDDRFQQVLDFGKIAA